MRLFFRYLRQRAGTIAAVAALCAVFEGCIALYGLPAGAMLYPLILGMLILFVVAAVDYRRVRARHEHLQKLCTQSEAMTGALPQACTMEEEDYQAILELLRGELRRLEEASNRRYDGMLQYYTVWVHQIKTPIAAMQLTLQNEDSVQSRQLSSDLMRIEQYVQMVLAYLRLDSTSTDYVFRPVELDAVIGAAVKKFAGEFIGRHIRLEYTPVRMNVISDEKWLGFVLEQLLSNALKYTRAGSVRIYSEGAHTLCIADTGIGIAPQDLPRIFENGYTGGNGRRDMRASGIGLYLCHRICRNLGIGISAQSEIGRGTVIRLDLEQHRTRAE